MASPHTRANRGSCPTDRRTNSLAPSQSCTSAGSTASAPISPSVSTRRCRLRPLIFFRRVVAVGATRLGRLDGLRVDHTGAGRVGAAVQATKIDAEDVMNLLPKALIPPGVEVVADRLPGREVMRQHPPGT